MPPGTCGTRVCGSIARTAATVAGCRMITSLCTPPLISVAAVGGPRRDFRGSRFLVPRSRAGGPPDSDQRPGTGLRSACPSAGVDTLIGTGATDSDAYEVGVQRRPDPRAHE